MRARTDCKHQYPKLLPRLRMQNVRHGTSMTLILLHGRPELWCVWCKNVPVLVEQFDVIVPGH